MSIEEKILKFWQENRIFELSLKQQEKKPVFAFLDGPPFASGMPHWGHLSTWYPKDTISRFWTQNGHYCVRNWGWDCHGLPVESFVQKKLNVSDKRSIEKEIGIAKFNEICRENAIMLDQEWRQTIARSGRWVDMNRQYRTMDNEYIESVWWGVGQLASKGLLKKDYRVSLYSWTMGASLSHFEIADDVKYVEENLDTPIVNFVVSSASNQIFQNQILEQIENGEREQIQMRNRLEKRLLELSEIGKVGKKTSSGEIMKDETGDFQAINWETFKTDGEILEEAKQLKNNLTDILDNLKTLNKFSQLLKQKKTLNLLVWTTTPWTLPANVALAVGAKISYSLFWVETLDMLFVVAENRAVEIFSYLLENGSLDQVLPEESEDSGDYFQRIGLGILKIASLEGADLTGLVYEPLFKLENTYLSSIKLEEKANMHKVYVGDFVSDEDGTGIVHIAPAYGQEDQQLRKENNLPVLYALNGHGELLPNLCPELSEIGGQLFFKSNDFIVDILQKKKALFASIKYMHKVPVFARDNSKIYYAAQENWYIRETQYLDLTLEINQNVDWKPENFQDRFIESVKNAPDWCISRQRYWGSPLPVWETEARDLQIFVDSMEKLRKFSLNPIYQLLNHHALDTRLYGNYRTVVITDNNTKLPLGLGVTQFRSKELTLLRQEKEINLAQFAPFAQKLLEEALALYDKYEVVQILFDEKEQVMFTTWLSSLDDLSQKITKSFYFYKKMEWDKVLEEYVVLDKLLPLDLHRPYIDHILLKDEVGNIYKRVPDILDCWVDSGSAPWAAHHYPFENKELVENQLPVDYVVEYVAQIRGWFHALQVLSAGIFGRSAFKLAQTHGTLLGQDGKKMSKSRPKYALDPMPMIEKFGSDAVRLHFYLGSYFNGEEMILAEKDVTQTFQNSTLLLRNIQKFLIYLKSKYKTKILFQTENSPINPHNYHFLNLWLLHLTDKYASDMMKNMLKYDLQAAGNLVVEYLSEVSTWYIRRVKDLLETDVQSADILLTCMRKFAIWTASILPFNMEVLWEIVSDENKDPISVHLTTFAEEKAFFDRKEEKNDKRGKNEKETKETENQNPIFEQMNSLRDLCSQIHKIRKEHAIRVRQPLYVDLESNEILLKKLSEEISTQHLSQWTDIFLLETNLLQNSNLSSQINQLVELPCLFGKIRVDLVIDEYLQILGFARDLERALQDWRKKNGFLPNEIITTFAQIGEIANQEIWDKVWSQFNRKKVAIDINWTDKAMGENTQKLEIKEFGNFYLWRR